MSKISLRKGILAVGLVMALSPTVLLAEDLMTPDVSAPADVPAVTTTVAPEATVKTPAEIQKAKQEQKRKVRKAKAQQKVAEPAAAPVKEIQDIPDPKNLGDD